MVKVHTRIKRKLPKTGRNRPVRPKSFRTEESAKRYAEAHDIKDYVLTDSKPEAQTHKFRIVPKEKGF
ncbi:MAG: hypothetical protein GXP63_04035 [DPANN group archaeon]|nr:hypothetical protein [DPANN group archaeon]